METEENVSREKIVEKGRYPFDDETALFDKKRFPPDKVASKREPKKVLLKKKKTEKVPEENLKAFKEAVENAFHDDFFKVMRDVIELKYPGKVMAEVMLLFAKYGRGDEVSEDLFIESYEGVSLKFTITALKSMVKAVKTNGKTPIIWRTGALCRR